MLKYDFNATNEVDGIDMQGLINSLGCDTSEEEGSSDPDGSSDSDSDASENGVFSDRG